MPELPEVESLAIQLRKNLEGSYLEAIHVWTPSVVRGHLPDTRRQKLSSIIRRGKYLFFSLSSGAELWFHLGMTGQLLLFPGNKSVREKHDHLQLEFQGRKRLVFRDIRRFGGLYSRRSPDESLKDGILKLGPDPYELSAEKFADALKKRTGKIKSLLLDQTLVSGIGNIYADESLHRAGIHPGRRPAALSRKRLCRLHSELCDILTEATKRGGSSVNDYRHLNGASGRFQELHRVYGKEKKPCSSCFSEIRRIVIGARSTHFCPCCQK